VKLTVKVNIFHSNARYGEEYGRLLQFERCRYFSLTACFPRDLQKNQTVVFYGETLKGTREAKQRTLKTKLFIDYFPTLKKQRKKNGSCQ
jgi:hypothetical protein